MQCDGISRMGTRAVRLHARTPALALASARAPLLLLLLLLLLLAILHESRLGVWGRWTLARNPPGNMRFRMTLECMRTSRKLVGSWHFSGTDDRTCLAGHAHRRMFGFVCCFVPTEKHGIAWQLRRGLCCSIRKQNHGYRIDIGILYLWA